MDRNALRGNREIFGSTATVAVRIGEAMSRSR
jgi:hypothetical protein